MKFQTLTRALLAVAFGVAATPAVAQQPLSPGECDRLNEKLELANNDTRSERDRLLEKAADAPPLTAAEWERWGRGYETGTGGCKKDEVEALGIYHTNAKTSTAARASLARLMAALQARSARKDPEAMYAIGMHRYLNIGPTPAIIVATLEGAANAGHSGAARTVASIYSGKIAEWGMSRLKNGVKHIGWLRRAAALGSYWAEIELGSAIRSGEATKVFPDIAQDANAYRKALVRVAERDPAVATPEQADAIYGARSQLGDCHFDRNCSSEFVRSAPEAYRWYRRARQDSWTKDKINELLAKYPQLAEADPDAVTVAAAPPPSATIAAVATAPVARGPRVALVIGNGAYTGELGQLANPVNDARLIGDSLRAAGFQVEVVTDADQRAMKDAIRRLGQRVAAAGANATGLFYYAGHGVQSRGINYLAPINAPLKSEADLELDAVAANTIVAQLKNAGAKTSIMILDACRNMPLARESRDGARGLARMDSGRGSYIAYSTAPGETAADGAGRNSLFSAALATEIVRKGQPIETVFRRVRSYVSETTGGKQTPWGDSSLTEDFTFTP